MTAKSTDCGFEWGLEDMKYKFKFIFSFVRSGIEVKRGVISAESGEWSVSTLPSLLCLCVAEPKRVIDLIILTSIDSFES